MNKPVIQLYFMYLNSFNVDIRGFGSISVEIQCKSQLIVAENYVTHIETKTTSQTQNYVSCSG